MKWELFISVYMLLSFMSCSSVDNDKKDERKDHSIMNESSNLIGSNDVIAGINLTVSEGKRLIAKGIAMTPRVQEKMANGMVIITRGTTNTYIAEELVKITDPRGSFLTGHFVPEGVESVGKGLKEKRQEIIINDGKVVDMSYTEALKRMKEGDIIFKGANLLNYANKQAAVCIGAPDGGTTYRFLPYVGDGKAELIIPMGLEKETSADLVVYSEALGKNNKKIGFVPKLHVYETGTVFTEIEAIKQIADVNVFPYGVGGVKGREGGVSLVISGSEQNVKKVLDFVKTIQGEDPFVDMN